MFRYRYMVLTTRGLSDTLWKLRTFKGLNEFRLGPTGGCIGYLIYLPDEPQLQVPATTKCILLDIAPDARPLRIL